MPGCELGDAELAGVVGLDGASCAGGAVGHLDGGAGQQRAAGVGDRAGDGAGGGGLGVRGRERQGERS